MGIVILMYGGIAEKFSKEKSSRYQPIRAVFSRGDLAVGGYHRSTNTVFNCLLKQVRDLYDYLFSQVPRSNFFRQTPQNSRLYSDTKARRHRRANSAINKRLRRPHRMLRKQR